MADDADARDERLSGLLEVEPLDELTRRRLVGTAMRASAPPASRFATAPERRSARRLAAAAAIVAVVIAAGIAYLVSRDGDSTTPTASRARPSVTTPSGASNGSAKGSASAPALPVPQSERGAPGTFDTAAPAPRDAGDFGDLGVTANLDRLRGAFTRSDAAAATVGEPPSDRVTELLTRLRTRSCASELPDGAIVGIATGRFGARDAIVLQTELPDGSRSINAVVAHPCEVRPLH